MNKIKVFFSKAAEMFGFKKSTKYVNEYLHKANIRSGVFMAAVVVILELWLVIRQHIKYIIAEDLPAGIPYFQSLFDRTSLYWVQMFMALSMFFYCLFYLSGKKSKNLLISVFVTSGIGVALCCMLPMEAMIKNWCYGKPDVYLVHTILLIVFYCSVFLYHVAVVIAAITRYRGRKIDWLQSVVVITIFATCLLIFGIRVSYGDFASIKKGVANPDYKQIICFLMMTIYVGCLLIWRPYISIAILAVIFYGFYFLLEAFYNRTGIRKFADGDTINYITFLISLVMVSVSIYSQRHLEAKKDEELELLATVDKLTGLSTYGYFLKQCDAVLKEKEVINDEYAFLFLNVSLFKVYNDQKGYEAGNQFLIDVGSILKEEFSDAIISRQSDDHFVVFTKNYELIQKLDEVRAKVRELDKDIKPNIMIGYYLTEEGEKDAHASIEKARYASAVMKRRGGSSYLAYDNAMHDRYNLVQYIVSSVDEAVQNGWIVAYYQPVVYSKDGKLCGVEALARWIDPKYGFLNPGVFIGALEDAHLAHKVDLAMLELVCKNMREVLDKGGTIVPTSINFSRADFSVVDLPEEILRITNKYKIPKEYLHVEITESALLDDKDELSRSMAKLRKNGFAIWLDDFGSGYSSFNAIKDYAFDVVKLDMEFLKNFDNNEKAKPVIESVIKMADSINIHTLCEGVETKEQSAFLKKIGCEKQQGYLFSKPISYEELNKKIDDGELVIAKVLN